MAPSKPLDHEECRKKVCIVCLRKSDKQISNSQIQELRAASDIFKNIQPWDQRVPTGICKVCSVDLSKIISGNAKTPLKFPTDFCYSKEVLIAPKTRSNAGDTACLCLICKIGRVKPIQPHPYYNVPFNKIIVKGRPITVEKKEPFLFDNNISIQDNLLKLKESEPKKSEQFAQQIIKEKEASPGGTKYLPQKEKLEKAVFL